MALAYVVVLVQAELFDRHRRASVEEAQHAADQRFEALAQESMKGLVTRNPEPRVMTHAEMRNAFPTTHLDGLVGLYFTADIT